MVAPGRRLALALTLATPACGPDEGAYPFVRAERDAPDAGQDAGTDAGSLPDEEPLEPWDETGAGPLTGIFLTEVRVEAKLGIPLASYQLVRLRLVQRGSHVRQRISLCRLLLPSVPGVATLSVPPALEAVLRARGAVREGDFLSYIDPVGARYEPGPEPIVVGAVLADPIGDPLPTPDAPAAAIDEDHDGQPGVTLEASTILCDAPAALYASLRVVLDLRGEVADLDHISGDVGASLDQSVLGWSHDCLAAAAQLPIEVLPGSTFRALRVGESEDLDDNGNVSCHELAAAAPGRLGGIWEEESP